MFLFYYYLNTLSCYPRMSQLIYSGNITYVFIYPAMSALIQADLSYCVCRIPPWCRVFWYNMTCLSFYKLSLTFQHSSLCPQVEAHLTLLPRNQSDKSNTLLHFSASHLFVFVLGVLLFTRLLPSFVSIPHLLASYTCRFA